MVSYSKWDGFGDSDEEDQAGVGSSHAIPRGGGPAHEPRATLQPSAHGKRKFEIVVDVISDPN